MNVKKKGFVTGFDHEAVAYEQTAPDLSSEYRRRIRIAAGNFQSIWHVRGFLNPLRGPVAFSLWSHKIMRWLVPFFLIILMFTNIMLARSGWFYATAMAVQGSCYTLAAIGHFSRRSAIFKVPYYFTSMNIAMLHGFILFMKGKQKAAWERTPR